MKQKEQESALDTLKNHTQPTTTINSPMNCYVILLAAGSGSRIRDVLLLENSTENPINNLIESKQLHTPSSHIEHTQNPTNYKFQSPKKQFLNYKDAPLWWQSVLTFHACPRIKGMVLVFPDDENYTEIVKDAQQRRIDHNLSFPFYFAKGGKMRHHSVYNGLSALPQEAQNNNLALHNATALHNNHISHVLIHDSARPFFTSTLVHNLLDTMDKNPHIHALIPAISLNDTIKIIQEKETNTQIFKNQEQNHITKTKEPLLSEYNDYEIVSNTPERHLLRAVQTPQAFHLKELIEAHIKIYQLEANNLQVSLEENIINDTFSSVNKKENSQNHMHPSNTTIPLPVITDDAMIMEFYGHKVFLIDGEEKNVKITHPKDLALLDTQKQRIPCSGYGYDVHRFGGDRPFILGGISIPTNLKIQAHSDGDVLLHALMDALLSCLCLGDIGTHFPDTDKKFENISSSLLLDHVMGLWHKKGLQLCHVDLTIITQKPKIAPFAKEITKNIARLLGINQTCINTKATTEEKLGFTGEGLGIKAIALVSALKNV